MEAVILAGGKGRRLLPYTTSFPKPLVPIGEKPIMEILIKQLADEHIKDIVLAIGHLGHLLQAYFGDGHRFGVNIKYSMEKKPLGTVGPLDLVKNELDSPFYVMNGDVLTDISFNKLMTAHKKSKAICTIGLYQRDVNIDFGVVHMDKNNNIVKYLEKPTLPNLVSMGIYVFDKQIFQYIRKGKKMDLPDLINLLLKNGKKVKGYLHKGYWLDIGRVEDYERACKDIG